MKPTREQILARKRIKERERVARIRQDPEKYAELLKKRMERYWKQKQSRQKSEDKTIE